MSAEPSETSPLLWTRSLQLAGSDTLPSVEFDMDVFPGELQLVFSQDLAQSTAIVDALLGLNEIAQQEVQFLGQVWTDLTPAAAHRLRGSIGRVLHGGNWLGARSVMENLLLPLRHHTTMPDEVLRETACDLARHFGLPGLPTLLPHQCPESDLERAACIKAFLGRPQLVILEHPMEFADFGLFQPLMEAIQQMRRRHGAVIWFTRSSELFRDQSIPASRRLQIAGRRLIDIAVAA